LKLQSRAFIGAFPNALAVTRSGKLWVLTHSGTRTYFEEFSSSGRKLHQYTTTFGAGGNTVNIAPEGIAVTPNGHTIVIVGNSLDSGGGFGPPLVVEYSATSGRFVRGVIYDTDSSDAGTGIAIDPEGQYIFLGAQPQSTANRSVLHEFTVSGLRQVNAFDLNPGDLLSGLAFPRGEVYALVARGNRSYVEERISGGGYLRSFNFVRGGLALNSIDQLFSGTGFGRNAQLERFGQEGQLEEHFGHGDFKGSPVAQAVDGSGDVWATDNTSQPPNDATVSTILKFTPQIVKVRIAQHPPSVSRSSTARFLVYPATDVGVQLECRLNRAFHKPAGWSECFVNRVYRHLSNGTYEFQTRAISYENGIGPAASYRFAVRVR
jgi:hypothetical protein